MNTRFIDEAFSVLRMAGEKYGRVYVMFSGGKDSLVALDLASRVFRPSEMKIIYVEVTGNTDKCNIEYVYRIHDKYYPDYELIHLKPYIDFYEAMIKNGIPGLNARWCMTKYKVEPCRRFIPPVFVLGIKRSDSLRRAQLYTSHIIRSEWGFKRILVLPIINWSEYDILEYIRENGLEISPCYRKYGHSGNCMFCPYHRKKAVTLTLLDPCWRNKIINALKQIRSLYDEHNRSSFKQHIIRYWLNNPVLNNQNIMDWKVVHNG